MSEKRIEPGVPVDLSEGDTLRVGGSTRVYSLHWIPMDQAYEVENRFVSLQITEEKEEENAVESFQDDIALSIEDECAMNKDSLVVEETPEASKISQLDENEDIEMLDVILESVSSLFSNCWNSEFVVKKEIPSAPPMPENLEVSICDEEDDNLSRGLEIENELLDTFNQCFLCVSLSEPISEQKTDVFLNFEAASSALEEARVHSEAEILEGTENPKPPPREHQNADTLEPFSQPLTTESVSSSQQEVLSDSGPSVNFDTLSSVLQDLEVFSAAGILEGTENQKPLQLEHEEMDILGHFLKPLMTDPANSTQPEELTDTNSEQVNDEENQVPLSPQNLHPPFERRKEVKSDENGGNFLIEFMKNAEKESMARKECECESQSFFYSVNSSLPTSEVCSELAENEKSETLESRQVPVALSECEKQESSPRSEKSLNLDNTLWSRRGKPASALQLRTYGSTGKKSSAAVKDAANKLIPQSLFLGTQNVEDEIFTPDKENFTPNTLLLKSSKRKGKLEESKDSSKTSKLGPIFQHEEVSTASSDKENQAPRFLEERKLPAVSSTNKGKLEKERTVKKKTERNPLQPLPVKSAGKNISEASLPTTSERSHNFVCSKTVEKRIGHTTSSNLVGDRRRNTWTMVVDATSLLDRESRKSLQLLQGLKWTRLIIPRMVIRELDSLNRRGSLFRRKTDAAIVLEWIEDCMLKTKWWIHIQSSVEEDDQIFPTPPASPQSQFSESSEAFLSAATPTTGSLTELVSPAAEDHVLDYTLRFRTMKNDGQLVLLSNDVTMKIKAMAEGLLCETAQEFWESLVNPFSDRFLWAESSPRGQTWSCSDDVELRERYYRGPVKKPSRGEVAKGLKLILLHNSHYGQQHPLESKNTC